MNTIKSLITKYNQIIVYGFFGVCTTVVDFFTFNVFNVIFGEEKYLISNIIAWFASVVFAFFTNKIFVFKSKSWQSKLILKEISSFFSSRIFTLFIAEAGMYLLVDVAQFGEIQVDVLFMTLSGEMIAKIIVGVLVVIINYILSRLFIFKKEK